MLILLKMGYIWLHVQFQPDQYKIQEKKIYKMTNERGYFHELFDIFTKLC